MTITSKWRQHIEAWQSSGLSQAEYCAEQQINVRTFAARLSDVEMRRWTAEQAEQEVKCAIAKAGRGGGFILSDNHGEIPWQVPDEILLAIGDAVERWGRYPLDWIENFPI